MTRGRRRGLGRLLIAIGAPTVLAQAVATHPIPLFFAAGFLIAFWGGLMIADNQS